MGQGVLSLALGGLRVGFGETTVFRAADEGELTLAEFVERVRSALETGQPGIEVRRRPADAPQDPDVAEFAADVVILDDGLHQPAVELNIDRDNLRRNESPPPDGWVEVLGLAIELRITEGLTTVQIERPDVEITPFGGKVVAVLADRRAVELEDGTIVRIVDGTWVEHGWFWRDRLRTLAAVQEALDAGFTVLAHGRGVVADAGPPAVLVAIRIAFRLDPETLLAFGGRVVDAQPEAGVVVFAEGPRVRVVDRTILLLLRGDELQLIGLAAVRRALDDGLAVFAKGVGVLRSTDPAADDEVLAIAIVFRFEHAPAETVRFAGAVVATDPERRGFVLDDGTLVVLGERSASTADGGEAPPWRLAWVQEALDAGLVVVAAGEGVPIELDDGTAALVAVRLEFDLRLQRPTEFSGRVVAVNLDRRVVRLDDDRLVRLIALTRVRPAWTADFEGSTLEAVALAVANGVAVSVAGGGELVSEDPWTVVALGVEFDVGVSEFTRFEGRVASVDPAARSVTLSDGTLVAIGSGTAVGWEIDVAGLEGLAARVEGGAVVTADGIGVVLRAEPLAVLAARVRFASGDG